MREFNSHQRKILSAAAHSLKPVVQIGQNGISDNLIQKVDESLNAHELIKVKFLEFKEEKQDLTQQLCEACNATLIRIIGNIAVLYRAAEEEDRQNFESMLKE